MSVLPSHTRFDSDDRRWSAVRDRDTAAEGVFYFAVETTGVVCRPGCPARTPHRTNVRFFDHLAQALTLGYRPCRRCQPDRPSVADRHLVVVAMACGNLESTGGTLTLEDLADDAGMSPAHFHRVFKAVTGVTPKQYASTVRSRRLRQLLAGSESVTRALYEAGFGSSGSFYAIATDTLGMPPGAYRDFGTGETIAYVVAPSSAGMVLAAATDRGICMIALGDAVGGLEASCLQRFRSASLTPGSADFDAILQATIASIDHTDTGSAALPLEARRTVLEHQLWQAMRLVPAASMMRSRHSTHGADTPPAAGSSAADELSIAAP